MDLSATELVALEMISPYRAALLLAPEAVPALLRETVLAKISWIFRTDAVADRFEQLTLALQGTLRLGDPPDCKEQADPFRRELLHFCRLTCCGKDADAATLKAAVEYYQSPTALLYKPLCIMPLGQSLLAKANEVLLEMERRRAHGQVLTALVARVTEEGGPEVLESVPAILEAWRSVAAMRSRLVGTLENCGAEVRASHAENVRLVEAHIASRTEAVSLAMTATFWRIHAPALRACTEAFCAAWGVLATGCRGAPCGGARGGLASSGCRGAHLSGAAHGGPEPAPAPRADTPPAASATIIEDNSGDLPLAPPAVVEDPALVALEAEVPGGDDGACRLAACTRRAVVGEWVAVCTAHRDSLDELAPDVLALVPKLQAVAVLVAGACSATKAIVQEAAVMLLSCLLARAKAHAEEEIGDASLRPLAAIVATGRPEALQATELDAFSALAVEDLDRRERVLTQICNTYFCVDDGGEGGELPAPSCRERCLRVAAAAISWAISPMAAANLLRLGRILLAQRNAHISLRTTATAVADAAVQPGDCLALAQNRGLHAAAADVAECGKELTLLHWLLDSAECPFLPALRGTYQASLGDFVGLLAQVCRRVASGTQALLARPALDIVSVVVASDATDSQVLAMTQTKDAKSLWQHGKQLAACCTDLPGTLLRQLGLRTAAEDDETADSGGSSDPVVNGLPFEHEPAVTIALADLAKAAAEMESCQAALQQRVCVFVAVQAAFRPLEANGSDVQHRKHLWACAQEEAAARGVELPARLVARGEAL